MNKRKKLQRKFNRLMREVNRNINNDNLWRGRFYLTQIKTDYATYNDGSGEKMLVTFAAVDKKTKMFCPAIMSSISLYVCNGYKLWEFMNWFIVEYIKAWESENPIDDATDYSRCPKIDINRKLLPLMPHRLL